MSIKSFSDFPHYIINDYFSELSKYYNVENNSKDNIITLFENMVTFEEPWLDFHMTDDFLDFGGNEYNTTESITPKIRLRGPKTNIVTGGSEYTKFYAKIDNYGYKPIGLKPTEDFIDVNYFNYDKQEYNESVDGIYTLEEVENDLQNGKERIKPVKLAETINKENDKYVIVERVSTNDDELYKEFTDNLGNVILEQIDITKSKPKKSHAFKIWKQKKLNEDIKLEPENELYLRKDSYIFKWFKKELKYLGNEKTDNGLKVLSENEKRNSKYFVWNHENFLNDNTLFNYVGCTWPIWPEKEKWKIYHRTVKDFMIEAIPPNDMDDKLNIFIWEIFDRLYQEIYNMQKNIYTLLDPEDTYIKFLGYLSLFYGINLDKFWMIPEERQRWYIKNLPYFLKKKGTWNSLWVSWYCIIDSTNKIEFFERWHDKKKLKVKNVFNLSKIEEVIDV